MDSNADIKIVSNGTAAPDFESAAIAIGAAIGGVIQGVLSEDILRRFAKLAASAEAAEVIRTIEALTDSSLEDEGGYTPLEDRLDIPEPDKSAGFVYIGNDTWLPKPLYAARKRQQRKAARKNESDVVWTR